MGADIVSKRQAKETIEEKPFVEATALTLSEPLPGIKRLVSSLEKKHFGVGSDGRVDHPVSLRLFRHILMEEESLFREKPPDDVISYAEKILGRGVVNLCKSLERVVAAGQRDKITSRLNDETMEPLHVLLTNNKPVAAGIYLDYLASGNEKYMKVFDKIVEHLHLFSDKDLWRVKPGDFLTDSEAVEYGLYQSITTPLALSSKKRYNKRSKKPVGETEAKEHKRQNRPHKGGLSEDDLKGEWLLKSVWDFKTRQPVDVSHLNIKKTRREILNEDIDDESSE